MKRLVLIDGHAILHRAFHALPPLTTSKGQSTGAVFGFCSMLLRVIQDLKSEYLAVAFDLPAPTFRQKLYADYQAQRPQMAEELVDQVEVVHKVLQTMEIPIFEKEGYEADDVIGTLATQAVKGETVALRSPASDFFDFRFSRDKTSSSILSLRRSQGKHSKIGRAPRAGSLEVIIVTGDRDMLQLVSERVKVYAPVKGLAQTVLYDTKLVEEKYGLKPSQWVDFKALVGDPSDNYPGVSGIGPKTAMDLLKKFETLENIYQNLDKLSPKQAKVLENGREQVEMAKKLAAIVTDTPVELELERCRLKNLKNPKVKELFTELEFKSLWERLVKNNNPVPKREKKEKEENNHDQLSLLN